MARTRAVFGLAVVAALAGLSGCGRQASDGGGAATEDYPSRQVTMLIPFAAGGSTDLTARAVAPFMEKKLGQPVLVVNKEGATGAVAMKEMVAAKPDGYTIIMGTLGSAVVTQLANDVGFTKDDYATVGSAAEIPAVLVVQKGSEYKTLRDFVDAARQRPNQITVGTAGATSTQHTALKILDAEEDVPLKLVPFEGGAPAGNALLGGNVDAFLGNEPEVLPNIRAGKFEPLALADDEKSRFLADVPTFQEEGVNLESVPFYGVLAPKDTPQPVIAKLEGALKAALEDPAVMEKLKKVYIVPKFRARDNFREFVDSESKRYESAFK